MAEQNKCPRCGAALPANAPAGLCPKCLMAAGLAGVSEFATGQSATNEVSPTSGSGPSHGFVPPPVEQLRGLFPQLEILELLGYGGMGAVYKARQTRLDRLVALKIIRPEARQDRTFAERFDREAKTLARLAHQHIVAVFDFGEVSYRDASHSQARPLYYFIMEYVDGSNLRQVIAGGKLQPAEALAIVPQICEALQFAHDEGVVHRDIKPENILIDKRGRVKIADFGLAKLVTHVQQDYTITGTHQVMGTPRYMAPEQMEGAKAVDHRADIYSLGVVFYEMLTGEVPAGHFDPPSKRVKVDVRLDEVVLRSMAQEPARRYQHASEVKTDVEGISGSAWSPSAPHDAPAQPPAGHASSPRLSAMAVTSFVLALIALVTGPLAIFGILEDPPPLDAPILLLIVVCALAGLCSTTLGSVALYHIRYARGLLTGLVLAYFGAVCAPLLALDAAILGVALAISEGVEWNWHVSSYVFAVPLSAALCVPLNIWIVRSSWHAVSADQNHKGMSKPRPAAESSEQLESEPFGFGAAVVAVFAVGWLGAGALRNSGVFGLVMAIVMLALLTMSVVRWKLTYLPRLRAELDAAHPIGRYARYVIFFSLFALAMLAVERFQSRTLDYHYYVRIGDVTGAVSRLHLEGTPLAVRLPDESVDGLDEVTRLHRTNTTMILGEAALYASAALLLLLAAIATLFGTRRFQYRWSLHLRPTLYVVSLQLLTLPLVIAGYMAMEQKPGWGITQPRTWQCDLQVDDFSAILRQWANDSGYERQAVLYGAESHGDDGTLRYASYRLEPRSTLTRWQYTRRNLLRPLPTMGVTCLAPSTTSESTILVELPWAGLDTSEESRWLAVVNDLAEHLGAETHADVTPLH